MKLGFHALTKVGPELADKLVSVEVHEVYHGDFGYLFDLSKRVSYVVIRHIGMSDGLVSRVMSGHISAHMAATSLASYYAMIAGKLKANFPNVDLSRFIFVGLNEPPVDSQNHVARTVAFNVEFAHAMRRYGLRAGLLRLSVGWPDVGDDGKPNWSPFEPVFDAAREGHHVIVMNEYWHVDKGIDEGWGWLAGRYITHCPWLDVPFLFTEIGGYDGWRNKVSLDEYAAQIAEYLERHERHPSFLAANVFTYGTGGDPRWDNWNIEDVAGDLIERVSAHFSLNESVPEPQPEPKPESQPQSEPQERETPEFAFPPEFDFVDEIVPAHPSNYDDRPNGEISAIVVHATGSAGEPFDPDKTLAATLNWFADPNSNVSAHFVVGYDGRIVQCVPVAKRAWHAGASFYRGRRSWNDFSVGIELVHPNRKDYPYSQAQLASLRRLVDALMERYHIGADWVVGHKQISGFRGKTDPAGLDIQTVLFSDRRIEDALELVKEATAKLAEAVGRKDLASWVRKNWEIP